jgi:hypothetical protein
MPDNHIQLGIWPNCTCDWCCLLDQQHPPSSGARQYRWNRVDHVYSKTATQSQGKSQGKLVFFAQMVSLLFTVYCFCLLFLFTVPVYCLLFNVGCLLWTVYFILCTVYCLLFTVFCLLFTVYCLLFTVYCLLFTVYYLLFSVYCLLFTVYCLLFTVSL